MSAKSGGKRLSGRTAAPAVAEPIAPAGDAFEREANRVADAVVRGGLLDVGRAGWAGAASGAPDDVIRRAPKEGTPPVEGVAAVMTPIESATESAPAGRDRAVESPGVERDSAVGGLLVDDQSDPERGQMRKSELLAILRAAVCDAVDEALKGTGRDSAGCPWIDHWFGYYQGRDAAQVERSLQRYAPEARGAKSARGYVLPVVARVRKSAEIWATTGEITGMPTDIPGPMAGGGLLNVFGGMFFKARAGGARAASPLSVRRQLGGGESLAGDVRVRMESAFGANFAGVRVHSDANAARLSEQLNARAFTVGEHVAFGREEFQPGTVAGDALIAHELAHVVQQQGAAAPSTQAKSPASTGPLEADADRSAMAFVQQQWLGARETAREVMPRLRTGLTLSRCGSKPEVAGKDLHAGAAIPSATMRDKIQAELHPTGAGAGAAPEMWDADSANPAFTDAQKTTRKADLKAKVTEKMRDHLTSEMPRINDLAGSTPVPITRLEGAGNAAKTVVDKHFSEWVAVAALTPGQSTLRHGFKFRASGAGKNLFDANKTTERAAAGLAINAEDLADWIANTHGTEPMIAHNFSPPRGGEEATFLKDEIVDPFVTAHKADLEKYDLFGFALTNPLSGKIVTPTATSPTSDQTPGAGGAPSQAERELRWSTWQVLVHEYIHTLAHPVFNSAGGARNRVMSEGFCTLFSEEVLVDQIPKAPKDAGLRSKVEGRDFGEPPKDTVGAFDAGDYKEYLAHAKAIQAQVGPSAMKAAFFHGHVEFLGLTPTGGLLAPVAVADWDLVTVPPGIATLEALAAAARVPVVDIRAANPLLPAAGPVSGQLHVPGAREHIVVSAGPGGTETKQKIAKQNGVTEAALAAANPRAAWGSLAAGERLLIPK